MAGCDGCTGYLEDIRMVAATLPETDLPPPTRRRTRRC